MTVAQQALITRLCDIEYRNWIIVDRDGTINADSGYTFRVNDLQLLPGASDALRRLTDRGFGVLIATNQAGIAHGHFTLDDAEQFNLALVELLRTEGVAVAGIALCPHHPDAQIAEFRVECQCRKPNPGMLMALIEEFSIRPSTACFVGNKPSDQAAAEAAGLPFFWARTQAEWHELESALVAVA